MHIPPVQALYDTGRGGTNHLLLPTPFYCPVEGLAEASMVQSCLVVLNLNFSPIGHILKLR